MSLSIYIAYFFAGAFLMNAVPHLVAAAMGKPLQSPFANPRGEGLSTSRVNFFWGMGNLVVAWLLAFPVSHLSLAEPLQALAFGLGMFVIGFHLSGHFGKFNGGNNPNG